MFRLLGPVRMEVAGHQIDLGADKQRCLMAALLMSPGAAVQMDELAVRIWGEQIPKQVRNVLATYVTRLRRLIVPAPAVQLRFAYGGYVLDCDPAQVDLHRAKRLMIELNSSSAAVAAESYRQLLSDWQTVALAGISGDWAARVRDSLQQQRLVVLSRWADAMLSLGRPHDVVSDLRDVITQHPGEEEVARAFMVALARAGQPAQALQSYERLRLTLANELGADPAPGLQELHRSILRREVHQDSPRKAADEPAAEEPQHRTPAQLPPDVREFAGRASYLDRFDRSLASLRQQPTAPMVCVIAGTAGVGKTALAVHWAHSAREHFPDGQLYVNLRGFGPAGAVTTPETAIHGMLVALGVAPTRVPKDLDSQIALYRTELDGKRLLVLLDNARDAGQVRPLLPGAASVVVLITSRNRLTSLVALEGIEQTIVELPAPEEATLLLSGRLGPARVAAEPRAAADIVASCARLPLALTVAAGRAAQRCMPLAEVAAELADVGARLDFLTAGDAASEVRSVFSWSYDTLQPAAAKLFRLLGLHFGPEIAAPAAAALLGTELTRVKPLLAELTQTSLLDEDAPGRYTFHDLLRHYAAGRAQHEDSAADRELAVDRLLCHYLRTACSADRLLNPLRDPMSRGLAAPRAGVATEQLADRSQAMAWFAAERQVLLAAVRQAAESKLDILAWQLAWTLTTFLTRRGPWHELMWAWHAALQAAERLNDSLMQAEAHRHLAQVNTELGHYAQAWKHSRLALNFYAMAGYPAGKGHTHYGLAILRERQGRPMASLRHARMAYTYFLDAHHQHGQAVSLNGIGWCEALLGNWRESLFYCSRALDLLRMLGDEHGEADTWDTLGYAHHCLSEHDKAVHCYLTAIELYRQLGDRYYEAAALMRLGDAYRDAGHGAKARYAWRCSLSILTELDHPVAEEVAARLHAAG